MPAVHSCAFIVRGLRPLVSPAHSSARESLRLALRRLNTSTCRSTPHHRPHGLWSVVNGSLSSIPARYQCTATVAARINEGQAASTPPDDKPPKFDLSFNNTELAYGSKTTWELVRAFLVLKLSSYDILIKYYQPVSPRCA